MRRLRGTGAAQEGQKRSPASEVKRLRGTFVACEGEKWTLAVGLAREREAPEPQASTGPGWSAGVKPKNGELSRAFADLGSKFEFSELT
ncbi:hypothetical protein NDU88_006871 [Pleurodeles waltl]|uniref:Uncharacterized protein n=1 Tax=Pleurodeles waltl TaxID=8319 RepID=A0AAV7NWD7_PLEWA|nr:hypothetical protein NDU88_006871 [Pleurodeles waltl]